VQLLRFDSVLIILLTGGLPEGSREISPRLFDTILYSISLHDVSHSRSRGEVPGGLTEFTTQVEVT
jgi:hypothetical protein